MILKNISKWLFVPFFLITIFTGCSPMEHTPLSYGALVKEDGTEFHLYAPKADKVYVVIFEKYDDEKGNEYPMKKTDNDKWRLTIKDTGYGTLYGYRIEGGYPGNDPKVIIADPYSKAAVTQNTYRHVAKSLVINTSYDWDGDQWMTVDPRDLIIYEMHVRDMTAHPNSNSKSPGTYYGLANSLQRGGIAHLKDLGINAVQILPIQDFANVEVPFKDDEATVYNSWNPYARNHWGYMTTFFFAPETYYATDGTSESGKWNGIDGRAVKEVKDMVKALHHENIAVIMDVVYNHVSNYDFHPFKYIDKATYFRLDDNGNYIAHSGCGNDTQTEQPVMQQLILDSVKYWMTEYHIDGFRFDLGNLIDAKTREMIIAELRAINPNVIILAEPWGDGYDPSEFSDMGWASFNDQFRNGVKGQNPNDGLGFIFGEWQGENSKKSLWRFITGSLRKDGGQYVNPAHSVNYLESHDDYTLGDFIRLGTRHVNAHEQIIDRKQNAVVQGQQLAMNKLGALYLFTSQGITFIHQGQEWGRSKVIAETNVPGLHVGQIDHNSYEKDNETNWLNWDEKELNRELVDYYRGLIQLRKTTQELRHSKPEDFTFLSLKNKVSVGYQLRENIIVLLNGDAVKTMDVKLPTGEWQVLVDEKSVNLNEGILIHGKILVPPTSGVVLKKL